MTLLCHKKEGATIVESCLVMIFLCLILFGILQVSILTASSEILVYAASAGVRCRTVGYDDTMVYKAVHVAALGNMGAKQLSWAEEEDRIQEYLYYAENIGNGGVMSYVSDTYWNSLTEEDTEGWSISLSGSLPEYVDDSEAGKLKAVVQQQYPLTFPFVEAFYGRSTTTLSVESLETEDDDYGSSGLELKMENHSDLYIN